MLRLTTQKVTIWFLMPARMNFCHIPGTRILIVIMHSNFRLRDNNFKFKGNSLRLRVNSSKYKALSLRPKDNRDNKLLA